MGDPPDVLCCRTGPNNREKTGGLSPLSASERWAGWMRSDIMFPLHYRLKPTSSVGSFAAEYATAEQFYLLTSANILLMADTGQRWRRWCSGKRQCCSSVGKNSSYNPTIIPLRIHKPRLTVNKWWKKRSVLLRGGMAGVNMLMLVMWHDCKKTRIMSANHFAIPLDFIFSSPVMRGQELSELSCISVTVIWTEQAGGARNGDRRWAACERPTPWR